MRRLSWMLMVLVGCGGASKVAAPLPASGANVYYLNFDGQALTPGADAPTLNRSSLISSSVTLPAYLANDPQRNQKIQAIVAEVQQILSGFDIAVVTTRPSSGTYDMVVAGGTSQQIGSPSGLQAIAPVDCLRTLPRHVSFLFDLATGSEAARKIVGALGLGHGISASSASTDCMCLVDAGCTGLASPCTIGGANTPISSSLSCEASGVTVMDERLLFTNRFGVHP